MTAVVKSIRPDQHKVADLSLAGWGRREIKIAESEIAAINIGVAPAPFAYERSGGNWARSNGPLPVD